MTNVFAGFFILLGYILGSLCSAVIVSKIFDLPDPCTTGSNNPGATNVLRLAGKKYAAIVLLADILKGFIPVFLAKICGFNVTIVGLVGFAAVLGHMYPIFFRFKGGKGVATAIGVFFGLNFLLGVVVIATWLIVAKFSRYSSLASLVSMSFAPFYAVFVTGYLSSPLFFILLFILFKHKENIIRLIDGTESKINLKRGDLKEETIAAEFAEDEGKPQVVSSDLLDKAKKK
ncbi:MAG: glycerol-3-phosphate 1-O-acyltransferase PlsY [Proteobacteria bacterium]|nr:glycerol-3-phosphate 1-O-acyltransferase PlsY [Pseudomonadota bacterium]